MQRASIIREKELLHQLLRQQEKGKNVHSLDSIFHEGTTLHMNFYSKHCLEIIDKSIMQI